MKSSKAVRYCVPVKYAITPYSYTSHVSRYSSQYYALYKAEVCRVGLGPLEPCITIAYESHTVPTSQDFQTCHVQYGAHVAALIHTIMHVRSQLVTAQAEATLRLSDPLEDSQPLLSSRGGRHGLRINTAPGLCYAIVLQVASCQGLTLGVHGLGSLLPFCTLSFGLLPLSLSLQLCSFLLSSHSIGTTKHPQACACPLARESASCSIVS